MKNGKSNAPWPEAHVLVLRSLWADGRSATQIAATLNKPPINAGVTRCAVLGKIDRLGLARRITHTGGTDANRGRRVKAIAKVAGPTLSIDNSRERGAQRGPHNIPFMDRDESTCLMFVGGESHDTGLICGAERVEGKPYCKFCARIAYLPPETKRRVA